MDEFVQNNYVDMENGATAGVLSSENCVTVINTIITDRMHIADNICIDIAHRIGVKSAGKKRPICG